MESYIVKHKDELIRAASRSGGMFTALTDQIINQGGVVYGCALEDGIQVVHKRAVTKEQRDSFRGSKYVKSKMKGIIAQIKEDLLAGRIVLFSGTPCQVMAVKKQVDTSLRQKLICVDIVCHGTPSEKSWLKYVTYLQEKYKGKILSVNFRNKNKFGWSAHVETIVIDNKCYNLRQYTDLFYRHLLFPKACFACKWKSLERIGDITLGDAWGGKGEEKEFNDNKGVSLVLVNTDKGKRLFEQSKDSIIYKTCDIKHYMQEPLYSNYSVPEDYKNFWMDMDNLSWQDLYKKYSRTPRWKQVLRNIYYTIK